MATLDTSINNVRKKESKNAFNCLSASKEGSRRFFSYFNYALKEILQVGIINNND